MALAAAEHWNEDHVYCDRWQQPDSSAKLLPKVSLDIKAAVYENMFFYYCFARVSALESFQVGLILLVVLFFYNLYSGKFKFLGSLSLARASQCFKQNIYETDRCWSV